MIITGTGSLPASLPVKWATSGLGLPDGAAPDEGRNIFARTDTAHCGDRVTLPDNDLRRGFRRHS